MKEGLAMPCGGGMLRGIMETRSEKRFLPTTKAELAARGWDGIDVLIVSGDAYVDHPSFAAAVIGRVLEAEGLRVGIIAQPDWTNPASFEAMGRPRLFCGVTAGNLDSMLSNYTAGRRKRKQDSYSEGGAVGKRPNLAVNVYSQLARRVFPGLPVVVGGIEASLRRTVHYDYWQDKLRPSVLLDSKADILVYGMGERAIREIARRTAADEPLEGIAGTARLLGGRESAARDFGNCTMLPSYEECQTEKATLIRLAKLTEREQNPFSGKPLVQFHGARALLVEPPALPLDSAELDRVYELPYMRAPHPMYKEPIPAFTMIKESITVVRGCGGGCTFCGLGFHQGRFLSSRSEESVVREVEEMANSKSFHGTVTDLGGPTANLYGCRNGVSEACKSCRRPSCLYPAICPNLEIDKQAEIHLMRSVRALERVKHVFIQSGIRMELALRNPQYIRELAFNHTSGHLKIAPEHLHPDVVKRMRKPGPEVFEAFRKEFEACSQAAGKEQYLVPYFISNFPGSTEEEMKAVSGYIRAERWNLRQVQDFIPLPMTPAAAMYYSGLDYETEQPITVVRGLGERRSQMHSLKGKNASRRRGKR
ncbi:MAG: YgiQ family radical SAM protein [Kiritimatiellales bacterium]|nr:YgiQ family radical SAM protein [Kiritimatiellales bacterium]